MLRFWDALDAGEQTRLRAQIESIDFALIDRLREKWIDSTPEPEAFKRIEPVPVIPAADLSRPDAKEAWESGEQALRDGRVGLVLVAGGQGTRMGFDGPKGAFPIGPVSGRSLFAFHAEKIHNAQTRYSCVLPWYIMVGETNEADTKAFFEEHNFFGLDRANVYFFKQRMMPCIGEDGKFLLESKGALAMNPNGHGGSIPALVEEGIVADARRRGVDTLSYFQVDNWAVKIADPFFIGYHVLRDGEMSSKIRRKADPNEAAGVFCLCDGEFRVIEYTETDIYPEVLATDADGGLIHYAANAAMHVLDVGFVEKVYANFDAFPWHCSHKKIGYVGEDGEMVEPDTENGYKCETFIFDALRYCTHEPFALEVHRFGEFTPTKRMTGADSVESSRIDMARYWGEWLKAAGCTRDLEGVTIEISPQFAFDLDEFVEKARGMSFPDTGPIAIGPDGNFI